MDALVSIYSKNQHADLILYIGCGVGANSNVLKPYATKLIGVDPDSDAIRLCSDKKYDKVIQFTLEDLTINGRADVIVDMDILEHLPDDLRGVRKIHDLLMQDGVAII